MYESVMTRPLLISGTLALPVGWSAPVHHHPHAELLLVTQGSMTVSFGDTCVTVRAGEIVVYPPGQAHGESGLGPRPLGLMYVNAELPPVPGHRPGDPSGRLAQLVRWLVEDHAAGADDETLAGWLAAIRRLLPRGRVNEGVAEAVRAEIRTDPARVRGLGQLARAAGLGPRQLQRRYRAETGTSPMADLRRLRCEAAAGLLVSTDWPLERVARAAGFCDAFHLSKVFRARYGTPPGRMRSHGRAS